MDYRTIIKLFSERIGLENFVPDDEELCVLATEDGMEIEIQYFSDVNTILLSCELIEVPSDAPLEFYRWLSLRNEHYLHHTGVTLSVEEETSILYLTKYIHLENTNDKLFYDSVIDFCSAVDDVMAKLKEHLKYSPSETEIPQDEDEESGHDLFSANMIRI